MGASQPADHQLDVVAVEYVAMHWSFDAFEAIDADRAARLRMSPPWSEIVGAVRIALHRSLREKTAKFGLEESSRDDRDLRGIVQFPIGVDLFDFLFNGVEGYRAHFRTGSSVGLIANAQLVFELRQELQAFGESDVPICRLTSDFRVRGTTFGPMGQVAASLEPTLAKVWCGDRLIGVDENNSPLRISRIGPRIRIDDLTSWPSLYPNDNEGWLDVKGAFVTPAGKRYQPKSPEHRAAVLERDGTA